MNNAFDKLNQVRPQPKNASVSETDKAVEVLAEKHGFVRDSEASPKKQRRRSKSDPTESVTMRVSVDSWNVFVQWCDRDRMTYREAFDLLLRKAELI